MSPGAGASLATGAAGSESFTPFPLGQDPGERPPGFETPAWTEVRWSPETEVPATDICEQGWTPEEAQAAVEDKNPATVDARLVDGAEFAALLEQLHLPDPQKPSGAQARALHFFALPDDETGAIVVSGSTSSITYYYLRINQHCSVENLSSYTEDLVDPTCLSSGAFPLWGIPALSKAQQQCELSSGLYAFDAHVLEDSCAETPASFVGVFGFSRQQSDSASMWFPELAGHPASSVGYGVHISEGKGIDSIGDCGNNCECEHWQTSLLLEPGKRLTLTDERNVCDAAGQHVCTWLMESTSIYGPLP